jgi:hypothetical protein
MGRLSQMRKGPPMLQSTFAHCKPCFLSHLPSAFSSGQPISSALRSIMAIAPDSTALKHLAQSLRLVADGLETMQLMQSTAAATTQPAPKAAASPPSKSPTPDIVSVLEDLSASFERAEEQLRARVERFPPTRGVFASGTREDSRSSSGQKLEDKAPSQ